MNSILPQIYYIGEYTNLKELKLVINLFNYLLEKLFPATIKELNSVEKYLDLTNIKDYKNTTFYLEYNEPEYRDDEINKKSLLFETNENAEGYLKVEKNWNSRLLFFIKLYYI